MPSLPICFPVILVLCMHNYKQYYIAFKVGRSSKKAEVKGKSNSLTSLACNNKSLKSGVIAISMSKKQATLKTAFGH